MFLLDTEVLSALRRRECHRGLAQRLVCQQTADRYLSAATVVDMNGWLAPDTILVDGIWYSGCRQIRTPQLFGGRAPFLDRPARCPATEADIG